MSLNNSLNLIQEVKAKHIAMGAAGLVGAGLAAHHGLLGNHAENFIKSHEYALGNIKRGMERGESISDSYKSVRDEASSAVGRKAIDATNAIHDVGVTLAKHSNDIKDTLGGDAKHSDYLIDKTSKLAKHALSKSSINNQVVGIKDEEVDTISKAAKIALTRADVKHNLNINSLARLKSPYGVSELDNAKSRLHGTMSELKHDLNDTDNIKQQLSNINNNHSNLLNHIKSRHPGLDSKNMTIDDMDDVRHRDYIADRQDKFDEELKKTRDAPAKAAIPGKIKRVPYNDDVSGYVSIK